MPQAMNCCTGRATHTVAPPHIGRTGLCHPKWRRQPTVRSPSSAGEGAAADTDSQAGSVLGSALLVAGTTVGAGILALPAVTQEAGFVPSAATLTACCAFSAVTGLLVAEVNINIMRARGVSSGVSLITMAQETLGQTGALAASGAYLFLHYALLVAYISKAGEIVSDASGLPLLPAAAAFAVGFAVLCYASSQKVLDKLNGALVVLVVASFLGLLGFAQAGIHTDSLISRREWSAVPATLPVVVLAFVYHNIIPVISTSLGGDVAKIRTAVFSGLAIPWIMFISWEGAILGSLDSLAPPQAVLEAAAVPTTAGSPAAATAVSAPQLTAVQASSRAAAADTALPENLVSKQQQQQQQLLSWWQASAPQQLVVADYSSSSSSSTSSAPAVLADTAASSTPAAVPHIDDPLAALSAANPGVAPLIKGFSFLAIATSYIGFILGLTDFLADALSLPSGRQALLPYVLTVLPPFLIAVTNPDIFLQALDTAGTYGVLTLFGILPAAMAWSGRYAAGPSGDQLHKLQLVPGGKPVLLGIGGAAAGVVVNELVQLVTSTGSS